jgi:hypothetical protein
MLGCSGHVLAPDELAGPGERGPMGEPGEVGAEGPGGISCWDLDMNRLCDENEDVDDSGACDAADCLGPPGPAGGQGPAGPAGERGPVGPTGAQGLAGPAGERGPVGPTGVQGPVGLAGAQGPPGAAGPVGPPGATGPQGPPGFANCTWHTSAAESLPCPVNKHVLTGGCSQSGTSPIRINAPFDSSGLSPSNGAPVTAGRGWACSFTGGATNPVAIALCCDIN